MITKNIDKIMIEIKSNYSNYNTVLKDASITDNFIIPGICSRKVNINKSYNKMKKIGFYSPNNYVYKINCPKINLRNNLDKYIISGNNKTPNIYIFIELNNFNIKYLNQYNFTNYNFIVDYNFYINNKKIINELMKNNNSILIKSTTNKNLKKISSDYILDYKKNIYCYNDKYDSNFIDNCVKVKSNTIGNIKTYSNDNLYNIKENLSNGLFIKLVLNSNLIQELNILYEYINIKGYTIASIDNNLLDY